MSWLRKNVMIVLLFCWTTCLSCSSDYLGQLEKMDFLGITNVSWAPGNQALLLDWAKPDAKKIDFYAVFLADLGESDEPPGTIEKLSLAEAQHPSLIGEQITTVHKERAYIPLNLQAGHLYAIQVRAFAQIGIDKNTTVFGFVPSETNGEAGQIDSNRTVLVAANAVTRVAAANTKLDNPLAVKLLKGNSPLANEKITFALAGSASGKLSATTVTTDAFGLAEVMYTTGNAKEVAVITATHSQVDDVHFTIITEDSSQQQVIKVVEFGDGNQPEITSASVTVGGASLRVKAALFDRTTNAYLEDVPVTWSLVGGGFDETDLVGATSNATSILFSPQKVGTGSTLIQATCLSCGNSVVSSIDTTGIITVNQTLVPALLVVESGNHQSGVVDNVLGEPLRVKVTSSSGAPIPGVAINFTATQGGGNVVTSQPVITDAAGIASSQVRLSTSASSTPNHIWRATVVMDNSLTADFSATSLPASANKLSFIRQPALAFENFAFLTQPIIAIQDSFGNQVSSSAHEVTLTLEVGTGSLTGSLSKTAIQGTVTFEDVTYDTEEANVQISASANGLVSATSLAFPVGPSLASACRNQSIEWRTEAGGCKDQSTELVWSAMAGSDLTWHAAIWDAFAPGGLGLVEVESNDGDRTNEYERNLSACGGREAAGHQCSQSSQAYCHSLVQGGKSDWRLPNSSELQGAIANGLTNKVIIQNPQAWVIDRGSGSNSSLSVNMTTGAIAERSANTSLGVICVRDDRAAPTFATKLAFPSTTRFAVKDQPFSFAVGLVDDDGIQVNRQGVPVTLALAYGNGNLSGNLTAMTDAAGVAKFTGVFYDEIEAILLTASSPGYSDPENDHQLEVSAFPGGCFAPDNVNWATADGGCKHLGTGIVWSKPASSRMTWHDAIWDAAVPGAGTPRVSDHGWSNEYQISDSPCETGVGACTNSPSAYCHDLTEGGYDDWKLPSQAELLGGYSAGVQDQTFIKPTRHWSRMQANAASAARWVDFINGSSSDSSKGTLLDVVCIRGVSRPTPHKVAFMKSRIHSLVDEVFSVSVRIYSFNNERIGRSGTEVTIGLTSGTGNLSGTLTALTNEAGIVTFNVSYDKEETVRVGIVDNDAGLISDAQDFEINVTSFPGGCLRESSSFVSAAGGCQHVGSGLVWSARSPVGYAHEDANSYCASLVEGGYSDWSSPTSGLLTTIIGLNGMYINIGNVPVNVTDNVYRIDLINGSTSGLPGSTRYAVCVRNL